MAGFLVISADKLMRIIIGNSRRFSRSEFELAGEGLVATVDDELEGAGEC